MSRQHQVRLTKHILVKQPILQPIKPSKCRTNKKRRSSFQREVKQRKNETKLKDRQICISESVNNQMDETTK